MSFQNNVLVAAIPKCGTYLMAAYLKAEGYVDQELHVYNDIAEDYSGMEEENKIRGPHQHIKLDLVTHLKWSMPGTFVVGHPGLNTSLWTYLKDTDHTKAFFVIRDLREAMISQIRFLHKAGDVHAYIKKERWWILPEGPEKLKAFLISKACQAWLDYAKILVNWINYPNDNVMVVRFEDLVKGNKIQEYEDFLNISTEPELHVEDYLFTPTRTMTDHHTKLWVWDWNEEHTELFDLIGATNINKQLGYDTELGYEHV